MNLILTRNVMIVSAIALLIGFAWLDWSIQRTLGEAVSPTVKTLNPTLAGEV